jgi:hypothetical protein
MPVPEFRADALLPAGIHAATLQEIQLRFGTSTESRQRKSAQLASIVQAALCYGTIKRVLLWESFVSAKAEPNDLDYSLVVSVAHHRTDVAVMHRRFLVPFEARQSYGADTAYLVIRDYPLDFYIERLDFMCHRGRVSCGIVEVSLRGEVKGESP